MPLFAIDWEDTPAPRGPRRLPSPGPEAGASRSRRRAGPRGAHRAGGTAGQGPRPRLVVVETHPRRTYVAAAGRRQRWTRLYPSAALVLAAGTLLAGALGGWFGGS